MKQSEFLKQSAEQLRAHIKRVEIATGGLSDAQLSKDLPNGIWGVCRVLEHLNIVNEPYLGLVRTALTQASTDVSEPPKTGFWGRTLAKFAGPDKDVPAPALSIPTQKEFTREVVDRWIHITSEFVSACEEAEGKNINSPKFKNPFLKFMSLNVTDVITVTVAHTERHVRQIEERARMVS